MSPDKSDIEAHGLNASSCLHPTASFLHFLPPWPPTLLQSFPSCPEVIFVWILAELHCLMTAQSWDFMMQSMSKIGKEQKRSFSKCSRYRRGSYMWEICHHSRGLIMIPAHRERKRAPRYEGSNWAGSVSDSMKRGICLLWNPVGVCELHITHDLWLGRLFFFFFVNLERFRCMLRKKLGEKHQQSRRNIYWSPEFRLSFGLCGSEHDSVSIVCREDIQSFSSSGKMSVFTSHIVDDSEVPCYTSFCLSLLFAGNRWKFKEIRITS